MWAHLDNAPRGTAGTEAAPRAQITRAFVATLRALRTQVNTLEGQIADQLAAHPDAGSQYTSIRFTEHLELRRASHPRSGPSGTPTTTA